jgi:hypothetical protein
MTYDEAENFYIEQIDLPHGSTFSESDCYLDEVETGADRLHALGKWSPTVHPAFDVMGGDEIPF